LAMLILNYPPSFVLKTCKINEIPTATLIL
jgi:hypothetical protein